MTRFIHITATSPYFSCHEIIAEDKAVKRLETIKKNFHWYEGNSNFRHLSGSLSVTTGVVNPELPLR